MTDTHPGSGPQTPSAPPRQRRPRALSPWVTLALVLVTLVAMGAAWWPVGYTAAATVDLGPQGSALQEQVVAQVEGDQTPAVVIESLGLAEAGQSLRLSAEPAVLAAQDQGAGARLSEPATLSATPPSRLPWVLVAGSLVALAAGVLTRRRRRAGRE